MAKKTISVDELVLDAGTQSRASISEEVVSDYAEVLASNGDEWPFPPLEVYHDGNQYLVSSGFHRTLAARRNGRASVPCEVQQGTAWDAFLNGIKANRNNPSRPNTEDKHFSINKLLDGPEKLTQQEIAEIVGVSLRTVSRIVAERKPQNTPMACSTPVVDDPFDIDGATAPKDEEGGQDAQKERIPGSRRTGTETTGVLSRTPEEEFKIQRSKTVKTAEALMRAFYDLNRLRDSMDLDSHVETCKTLILAAKNWK